MRLLLLLLSFSVSAATNFEDLDAWKNVPVKALDQHPYWSNLHSIKATHPQGDEYRVHINRLPEQSPKSCLESFRGLKNYSSECVKKDSCAKNFDGSYTSLLKYFECSKNYNGCSNVFVIRNQIISYFMPVGFCYSLEVLRPNPAIIKEMLR